MGRAARPPEVGGRRGPCSGARLHRALVRGAGGGFRPQGTPGPLPATPFSPFFAFFTARGVPGARGLVLPSGRAAGDANGMDGEPRRRLWGFLECRRLWEGRYWLRLSDLGSGELRYVRTDGGILLYLWACVGSLPCSRPCPSRVSALIVTPGLPNGLIHEAQLAEGCCDRIY